MAGKPGRTFGRGEKRADPGVIHPGSGLLWRWQSLRVGHRAMIAMFGGIGLMMVLTVAQGTWPNMTPPWLAWFGIACAIAGLLYAYTRRCPGCDADSVIVHMAPRRRCEECGTLFLNERWF